MYVHIKVDRASERARVAGSSNETLAEEQTVGVTEGKDVQLPPATIPPATIPPATIPPATTTRNYHPQLPPATIQPQLGILTYAIPQDTYTIPPATGYADVC